MVGLFIFRKEDVPVEDAVYKLKKPLSYKNQIEQIEIQMRTQISHHLAMKYGAEGYMDPSNFEKVSRRDGSDVYSSVISAFKDECRRQSRVPFVEHHLLKYGGHFPVWVAVELFTFGNLTSLET